MDLGIQGKIALVLAAGGGLGSAIATVLAREGAAIAVSDVDACALASTVAQIKKIDANVLSEAADLMDRAALGSFVTRVGRELGHIDILVNISGGPPPTTAANVPAEQWVKQFEAMLVSLVHVTDLVLPSMRAKRWGRIITSASSGVVAPIPNLGVSNAIRSALIGWSKTLAGEVAAEGITVNVVLPGRIATSRIRQLDEARAKREGKSVDQIMQNSTASIPLQRYGEPEEYANVVAFLASKKASYITGTMIRVDGGMIQSV